jgi:arylsulfatase A-like enzyme
MQVLVYVVDCLRADHLSSYGYSRATTPNIDALAEDGIRYERCFTPSTWTRPTSVSLLTGTYPPTHDTRHRGDLFPTGFETLPESLSDAGFETLGVSTMGNVSDTVGHDRGFDAFRTLYKEAEIVRKRANTSTEDEQLVGEDRDRIALPRAEDVTDALLQTLDADASTDATAETGARPETNAGVDADRFSFCWCIDPHLPFDPPETHCSFLDPDYDGPIDGSFESLPDDVSRADLVRLRDLYDCEISYVDDQFGEIVSGLRDRGEYEDSLLVVLGDHGEAFHEHGTLFHGNAPYEEVLRVPLIVKPPADAGYEPDVVPDLVSLVDLYPTLLEILGVEEVPGSLQGRAVPPFGESSDRGPAFSETQLRDFEEAYYSVRTERWKYIETRYPSLPAVARRMYRARGELSDPMYVLVTLRDAVQARLTREPRRELYDLDADPAEARNLVADRPDRADEFAGRLAEWLRDCEAAQAERAEEGDIDAETAEQLKQLGYAE